MPLSNLQHTNYTKDFTVYMQQYVDYRKIQYQPPTVVASLCKQMQLEHNDIKIIHVNNKNNCDISLDN